jgi:peptidoglycan hydrolase-like protein with peptidoglycan-binding domain
MRAFLLICLAATVPAAALAITEDCRLAFARGQESAGVQDIQEQLRERGFDAGPVDGLLGRRTCDAVRAYQKAAGMPVNGLLDPVLQNQLRFGKNQPAPRRR